MVMGGDSCSKVVSSNPGTVYWMDKTFFTFICCKNYNDVCLERPKKRPGWPNLKKTIQDWPLAKLHIKMFIPMSSVTRLDDLLHFEQLFKTCGNNYFAHNVNI